MNLLTNRLLHKHRQILFVLVNVALLHVLFMAFSGKYLGEGNVYNSYSLQSSAWLTGNLALPHDYPHLELAIFQGQYYVSFPAFPSYVMLPFSIIWGSATPDSAIAFFVVLLGAMYAVKIAQHYTVNHFFCVFLPIFLYCGTNVWQVTVDGWVWFLAQNLALATTLMSFYYGLKGKKGRSMFFLCCAVGCRPFQILYLPLLVYLLISRRRDEALPQKIRAFVFHKIYCFLPAAFLGGSYLVLNFLRFGNIFEFGHNYLPEFTRTAEGQFSLSYVLHNMASLFRMPTVQPESNKWEFPMFDGVNLFLVFPILVFFLFLLCKSLPNLVREPRRVGHVMGFSLAICGLFVVHVFLLLMHKTMGGAHFGHRYLVDAMPGVFIGIFPLLRLQSRQQNRATGCTAFVACLLFAVGLLVNFTGVLLFYAG